MQLYFNIVSPPCQSVMLLAKKLDITLDMKEVNPHLEEVREELKKFNPQHTIPTFIDTDGHVVWESYAIAIYLVEKYGKDDSLYPRDPAVRSVVNQRLFFDNGVMFPSAIDYANCLLKKKQQPSKEMLEKLEKALGLLENFVQKRAFVAAEQLTIADLCVLSSITLLGGLKYELEAYPAVKGWIGRVTSQFPDYAEFHRELEEKSMAYIKTL
ncbi:glutathione S-transferase D4-like [Anopheles nili]|uniref:glutathione S-transferase D4-like n=1 Tax=Anopheles nili TaxID=185578 RepID=UPI00237BF172|nr:glutathione S-transferase D4-like [Anopheles nili]